MRMQGRCPKCGTEIRVEAIADGDLRLLDTVVEPKNARPSSAMEVLADPPMDDESISPADEIQELRNTIASASHIFESQTVEVALKFASAALDLEMRNQGSELVERKLMAAYAVLGGSEEAIESLRKITRKRILERRDRARKPQPPL